MKFKEEVIKEIDRRLIELNEGFEKTLDIPNERRIHPAHKQIKGRILELQRFRKYISMNVH